MGIRFRRLLTQLVLAALLTATAGSVSHAADTSATPSVGIWYSTWYTNLGQYDWIVGHGVGSSRQFMADVNGDGRADAVVFFSGPGDWYVALSTSQGFAPYSRWLSGFGAGSKTQFVADVNGDGKADAVAFWDTAPPFDGAWYAATSSGSSFTNPGPWIEGFGAGSKTQLLGDVNGDGKADAVAFWDTSPPFDGAWYAATSNGSNFTNPRQWFEGFGAGSKTQLLGDVNGDGTADAVAFWDTAAPFDGAWYVAASNGSVFTNPGSWIEGHGAGSQAQLLGDTNGDHKADAVVYFGTFGNQNVARWYDALSTGGSFASPDPNNPWKVGHGNYDLVGITPATWVGLGDTDGNGTADPVAFANADGSWRVLPAELYQTPQEENLWQAWNVRYRPIVHGAPAQYDSGDPSVIDEHLANIARAGIDYLLFDLTNNVETPWILSRAKQVCSRIAAFDRRGGNLHFAVAIGGIQFTNDPARVESEAGFVLSQFVNDPTCGPRYFASSGKPLLVLHSSWAQRQAWEAYTPKSETPFFTMLFSDGLFPEAGSYPSSNGNGCGVVPNNIVPPPANYGEYVGWGQPFGSLGSGPMMAVMPGWDNRRGQFVSRYQNSGGAFPFYSGCAWNRVTSAAPAMVVINSYNEFVEETAVEAADTTQLQSPSEKWPSPNYYWNLTTQAIRTYKPPPSLTLVSATPRARGENSRPVNVILQGSGFASGVQVTIAGTGVMVSAVTVDSDSQLTLRVAVSAGATVGVRMVTVKRLYGGAAAGCQCFTVDAAPTISSLSPNALARGAKNQLVQLVGSGLSTGATVSFSVAGVKATSVTVADANHLSMRVTVPSATPAGQVLVTVTNIDGGRGACSCLSIT